MTDSVSQALAKVNYLDAGSTAAGNTRTWGLSARCLGEPLPPRPGLFHHEHRRLVGVVISLPDHNQRWEPFRAKC